MSRWSGSSECQQDYGLHGASYKIATNGLHETRPDCSSLRSLSKIGRKFASVHASLRKFSSKKGSNDDRSSIRSLGCKRMSASFWCQCSKTAWPNCSVYASVSLRAGPPQTRPSGNFRTIPAASPDVKRLRSSALSCFASFRDHARFE